MQLSPVRLSPFTLAAAQHNLINGKLVESHAANAATFAVKTLAGADPSADDPVMCIFPDASILTITAALSLVIPAGVTVDIGASVHHRLWFAIVNDTGTPRIIARRCVTTNVVQGFDARGILSAAAATSGAVTNYSSVAITNKPYRVIAYADYETGVPTAGQWSVSPTRIIMVGPSTPLPGAIVQQSNMTTGAMTNCNSGSWVATAVTQVITPMSAANPILVDGYSDHHFNAAVTADTLYCQMYRNDATPIGVATVDTTWSYTTIWGMMMYSQKILDFPFTTAATRYRLFGHLAQNGGNYYYIPWGAGGITLQELMA